MKLPIKVKVSQHGISHLIDGDNRPFANNLSETDARRIVECVTALDGVKNPEHLVPLLSYMREVIAGNGAFHFSVLEGLFDSLFKDPLPPLEDNSYYWIKQNGIVGWEIAVYSDGLFYPTGVKNGINPTDVEVIGELIPKKKKD